MTPVSYLEQSPYRERWQLLGHCRLSFVIKKLITAGYLKPFTHVKKIPLPHSNHCWTYLRALIFGFDSNPYRYSKVSWTTTTSNQSGPFHQWSKKLIAMPLVLASLIIEFSIWEIFPKKAKSIGWERPYYLILKKPTVVAIT